MQIQAITTAIIIVQALRRRATQLPMLAHLLDH